MINEVSSFTIHHRIIRCGKSVKVPGPEIIKLFSCSAQLSKKFIVLINVNCWHFNILLAG